MPTEDENLVPIVRDINVLLSLGTYQDMTDDEIDSIIQYKIESAISSYDANRIKTAVELASEAQTAAYHQLALTGQTVLNSMLEIEIPWVIVAPDGTVTQNV